MNNDQLTNKESREYLKTGRLPDRFKKPIEAQKSLFKELSEGSDTSVPSVKKEVKKLLKDEVELKLFIKGFVHEKNKNGDPVPKQGDRSFVKRNRDGNVFTYTNKKTGKTDVIVTHYQPSLITATQKNYIEQIKKQLPYDWVALNQYVHIDTIEFLYSPLKSFSKKQKQIIADNGKVEKTTQADLDNLQKFVNDALESAGVMVNDGLISKVSNMEKYYFKVNGIIIKLRGK